MNIFIIDLSLMAALSLPLLLFTFYWFFSISNKIKLITKLIRLSHPLPHSSNSPISRAPWLRTSPSLSLSPHLVLTSKKLIRMSCSSIWVACSDGGPSNIVEVCGAECNVDAVRETVDDGLSWHLPNLIHHSFSCPLEESIKKNHKQEVLTLWLMKRHENSGLPASLGQITVQWGTSLGNVDL